MNLLETIGANIKQMRKLRGMSQEQLADKCNIARRTVIMLETGKSNFEIETLALIAAALHCKINLSITPKVGVVPSVEPETKSKAAPKQPAAPAPAKRAKKKVS